MGKKTTRGNQLNVVCQLIISADNKLYRHDMKNPQTDMLLTDYARLINSGGRHVLPIGKRPLHVSFAKLTIKTQNQN